MKCFGFYSGSLIYFALFFLQFLLEYSCLQSYVSFLPCSKGNQPCQLLSPAGLFVTPWTVACQAPLSMGFPRQEYCSGLPFPSQGDLHDPGVESWSPALQADSLCLSHNESAICICISPFWISFPFRSPQSNEQSPLCYIVGSHQLSLLYIVGYIYANPNLAPHSPLWCPYVCSLYLYISFANNVQPYHFSRFHTYGMWKAYSTHMHSDAIFVFLFLTSLFMTVSRSICGSANDTIPIVSCQYRRYGFDPCVGKIPWRRAWQPTPVYQSGKSYGQRRFSSVQFSLSVVSDSL